MKHRCRADRPRYTRSRSERSARLARAARSRPRRLYVKPTTAASTAAQLNPAAASTDGPVTGCGREARSARDGAEAVAAGDG